MILEVIPCPDPTCQAPAEVVDRWVLWSGDQPVTHVKTYCLRGHVFTPSEDSLVAPAAPAAWRRVADSW